MKDKLQEVKLLSLIKMHKKWQRYALALQYPSLKVELPKGQQLNIEWCTISDSVLILQDLGQSTFKQCDFVNVKFYNCILQSVEFNGCTFAQCEFKNCDFTNAKMSTCHAHNTVFTNCNFKRSELIKSEFYSSNFRFSQFIGTTITASDLRQVDWQGVRFSGVRLNTSAMYNSKNYDILEAEQIVGNLIDMSQDMNGEKLITANEAISSLNSN